MVEQQPYELGYGYCTSEDEILGKMRFRIQRGIEFRGMGYLVEGGVWIEVNGSRRLYNDLISPVVPFRVGFVPNIRDPKVWEPGINYLPVESKSEQQKTN